MLTASDSTKHLITMSHLHPPMTLASALPQRQCQLLVKPKASRPSDRADSHRIEPLVYAPSLGKAVKHTGDFAHVPVLDFDDDECFCRRSID